MKTIVSLLCGLLIASLTYAKPVRVGVAGMTHDHINLVFDYMKHPDDVEIIGFAEPNKELAMRLLKRHNLPESLWFASLDELIQKTKPEAVCAFNSIYQHLEVVKACAPKGVHVIVEKPLAVSVDHLNQMRALQKKYGIHLLTNFETTWYPSHAKVWDMVKTEQSLGTLRKVVIMDGHRGPVEIGCSRDFTGWLTDPVQNGGGALIDFGCYGANIMTWLMDGQRPTSVMAVTQQLKPAIYPKVDDEATIVLTYPTCQAIIQASWNWPFDRKDTEVYGTKGTLVANRESKMKYVSGERFGKETWLDLQPLPHARANVFAYLAAVVRGEIKPDKDLSSFPVNEVVVEILSAARESAKTGKVVHL
ncbi:Gfo/Idh/MocA family protein [Arsenicibacter rosenii]|uniref:Oxidoreductase n=1 Tax=Arsenicibacter rosenii TaxID=1750698 RepID=A0A1S2VBD1_9BACT|nr:Gfo/Idh/MocA family oxidoreductase [Arsenicibacter rosenii]OIN56002.1 oxidoreductase [Arsenicibacter rosenii]